MAKVERIYTILNASGGTLQGETEKHGEKVPYQIQVGVLDLVPAADRADVDASLRVNLIGKERAMLAEFPAGAKVRVTIEVLEDANAQK